jgi:two-component system chemotaxis sensor kinase CheA
MDDGLARESRTQVRRLADGLLALGRPDDDVSVDELFRSAHSLKGNLAMAGLDRGSELAHAVEDVLSAVRAGRVDPAAEPALVDAAVDAVDAVEELLDAAAGDGATADVDAAGLVETLRETLADRTDPPADADATPDASPGRDDDPATPDAGRPAGDPELSAEEALDRAAEFDDLEALVEEMDDDDASEFENLSGGGTFDELAGESTDESGQPDGETADEGTTNAGMEAFAEVQDEVGGSGDVEDLDRELEDVEFGEFDDDDDMSIQELVELEPDAEPTGATGGAAEPPTSAPDAEPVQPEHPAGDDAEADAADGRRGSVAETGPVGEDAADDDAGPGEATADAGPAFDFTDPDELAEPETDVAAGDADDEAQAEAADVDGATGTAEPTGTETADVADPAGPGEAAGDSDGTPVDATGPPAADDVASEDADDVTGGAEPPGPGAPDEPVPDIEDLVADDLDADTTDDESAAEAADADTGSAPDVDLPDVTADLDAVGTGEGDLPDLDLGAGGTDAGQEDAGFARDSAVEEFESRFGDLFDEGDGDEEAGATLLPANTIEESRLDAAAFRSPDADARARPATTTDDIQSIAVDVDTADDLLNLVEELSVTRLELDRAVAEAPGEGVDEALSDLGRVTTEFRRSIMDLRMMPIERALEGLPRAVRDVARTGEVEVAFEMTGTDVRLDRSVIDRLGEPLVHAVRNAVDHGIEPPAEREAAGKPREGTVRVDVERDRDRVVVEVTDDGRGIDLDEVLDAAVADGVVDAETAQSLPREEVPDLLFEAGLSTSDDVTEVSGRGVGMDVVERVVSDLGGDAAVETTLGEGTTVRLELPVTVAVDELLFVAAGDERFGIPVSVVDQVTEGATRVEVDGEARVRRPADAGEVAVPESGTGPGAAAGVDRGDGPGGAPQDPGSAPEDRQDPREPVPLIRLGAALDVPGETAEDGPVVWTTPETGLAIQCDRVVGTEESVVKPYEDILGGVPGVSGATMLGDGELVNVIDARSL